MVRIGQGDGAGLLTEVTLRAGRMGIVTGTVVVLVVMTGSVDLGNDDDGLPDCEVPHPARRSVPTVRTADTVMVNRHRRVTRLLMPRIT
jgi:hypothetical protein